jgi:hypothetical protein
VVRHPDLGIGRVMDVDDKRVAVNFKRAGLREFPLDEAALILTDSEDLDETEETNDMDTDEIRQAIRDVLKEEGVIGETRLAGRWEGGELILRPGSPSLKEKSIPIDTFFHKIVMLRDRLRLLEQNINSSKALSEAEKLELQQYITRCYGSLTTFNVLFGDKADWFVGEKGS